VGHRSESIASTMPRVTPSPRPFFYATLLCLLVSLMTGCSEHLAGTHDVELEYEIANDDGKAPPLEATRNGVLFRLAAVQLTAEVETTAPNRLRVVIDADYAPTVEDLIEWRGGLKAHLVDPACAPPGGPRSGPLTEVRRITQTEKPPADCAL